MRGNLTPESLFSEVIMLLPHSSTTALVVLEGDNDISALAPFVGKSVKLLPGNGKQNVLGAARLAAADVRFNKTRFIVDRDYDFIASDELAYPPNVLVTRQHDLLMDILCVSKEPLHNALDQQLIGISRRENKRGSSSGSPGADHGGRAAVIQAADRLAFSVAVLRIVSIRLALAIPFRHLNREDITPCPVQLFNMWASGWVTPEADRTRALSEISRTKLEFSIRQYAIISDHDLLQSCCRLLHERNISVSESTLRRCIHNQLTIDVIQGIDLVKDLDMWARLVTGERLLLSPS